MILIYVKYRDQGVQTLFCKSTPSAQDSMGNRISPGSQKIQGMREQISLMLQKNAITEVPPDTPAVDLFMWLQAQNIVFRARHIPAV